jgi:ABC-2 type transport system permease protein
MRASLKSELRKLLTVRSTYVIFAITAVLVVFFGFYAEGIRASQSSLFNPHLLADGAKQAILSVGLLGSLVGVLLVTHEYRYNTLTYTLTASNSRTKTLFAKLLVVTGFAVVFSLFVGVLSPVMTLAGIHAKGLVLTPQHLSAGSLLWEVVFVGWGYAMMAFIFAMIIRIQVGAISALFLVPAMVEPLLGLLMKKDAIYLPYNALQSVVQTPSADLIHISAGRAVGVVMSYIVVGLLASWILFLRRDATS